MNGNYIGAMIQPHIGKNYELTYDEFEEIFKAFTRKEQYQIIEFIQSELGVKMVDEKISAPKNQPETFARDKKNIRMTNEELIFCAKNGDAQAKQDLFVKNIGLVAQIAAKYHKLYSPRMELDDLIQHGMIGLASAVEKFDLAKGFKFSTYATWWIFQAVMRAISDFGFIIRLPVHLMEAISKIIRVSQELLFAKGREPTLAEIASEMNLPDDRARELIFWKENFLKMTSLDIPVNEDGDSTRLDFIPAPEEESVDADVIQQDLHLHLEKVLETLTPREKEVLKLRTGFVDGEEWTLGKIGKKFGLTRERIRQIEAKALRKIRHPRSIQKLKIFFR